MPTLRDQIHSHHQRLAARPLPTRWIRRHPELARYPDNTSLVQVLRNRDRAVDADRAVRALVDLARNEPDAASILLEALAWWLRGGIYRRLSSEYRDEILIELSLVILEATDLGQLDNLQSRLVRRAHARAARRYQAASRAQERETSLTALVSDPPAAGVDVASLATSRAQLSATVRVIHQHIDAGRLSMRSWEDCRDGVLAPAMGWTHLRTDRCRSFRGKRAVLAVLGHND